MTKSSDSTPPPPLLSPAQKSFRKRMLNPWLFGFFVLLKVPAGWLAGMKLKKLDAYRAVSTLPYRWGNKNPFRSTYFAVQSMAAELSTAAICLLAVEGYRPGIATIIVSMRAAFPKKATGKITFTCQEGPKIFKAVQTCLDTGKAATAEAKTVGKMQDGTVVAVFWFTWSFKQRQRSSQ